jgi:hypothetical protein
VRISSNRSKAGKRSRCIGKHCGTASLRRLLLTSVRRCIPSRSYYSQPDETISWPPEVHDYNDRFTRLLSNIKRRHDPVVTTVAQGILEFKRDRRSTHIDRSIQTFLDRFYMSRIGRRPVIHLGSDLACLHVFGRRHSRSHWPTYRPQSVRASRGTCLSLPRLRQV